MASAVLAIVASHGRPTRPSHRAGPARPAGNGFTLVELPAVSRRKARGFTLVELLVVVAIITLLLSILTPSLRRATELTRRTSCASNVHQILNGFSGYHVNNRMMFLTMPDPSVVKWGGHGGVWSAYSTAGGYGPNDRLLNPYCGIGTLPGDAKVPLFICPSDHGHGPNWPATTGYTYVDVGTSYAYNRWTPAGPPREGTLNPGNSMNTSIAVGTVATPSKTILTGGHAMYNFTWFSDRMQRWHDPDKPTSNIGFVDGHVRYVDIIRTATGDTEEYTWYPDGPRLE